MENTNKEEPIKHNFSLPSCILGTMLWTSRFLVILQLWHSDMSVFNIFLIILFYFIVMEAGIAFVLCLIHFLPTMLKDPTSFINANKNDLLANDLDFVNLSVGITTIAYLLIYFL